MSWYFTQREMEFVRSEEFEKYAKALQFAYETYDFDIIRKIVEIGSIFDYFDFTITQKEFAKAASSKLIPSDLFTTCLKGINILAEKTYTSGYMKYALQQPIYFPLKYWLSKFYYDDRINADQYRVMFINVLKNKGNGIECLTKDSLIDSHRMLCGLEQLTYKNSYTCKAAEYVMLSRGEKSPSKKVSEFCSQLCSKSENDLNAYLTAANIYILTEVNWSEIYTGHIFSREIEIKHEFSRLLQSQDYQEFVELLKSLKRKSS